MSIVFTLQYAKLSIIIKIPITIRQMVYIYMTAISQILITQTINLQTWYFRILRPLNDLSFSPYT